MAPGVLMSHPDAISIRKKHLTFAGRISAVPYNFYCSVSDWELGRREGCSQWKAPGESTRFYPVRRVSARTSSSASANLPV